MKLGKKKALALCLSGLLLQMSIQAMSKEAVVESDSAKVVSESSEANVLSGNNDSKLSVSLLSADNGDSAAAQNNTEGAKKLAIGEVSVSLPSGGVSVSVNTPEFSAVLDLSLSFSSGLYQSQKASGEDSSAFGLPYGMFFKGIPYLHKVMNSNKNYTVLFWGGADYYVDDSYASGIECDNDAQSCAGEYKSGLKYQVSKLYKFQTQNGGVNIKNEDGSEEVVIYKYKLTYANGATYYFNDAGLCVLVTDRYFENDRTNNAKHVAKIDYKYDDRGALSNQITSITDADGTVLTFKSSGSYISEIDYPKNSSGQGEVFKFNLTGGSLSGVSQRLDDEYDLGFTFSYDSSGLVYKVKQVLFSRGSFHVERSYVDYVFHYNKFSDDGNTYKVTELDKVIYGGTGEQVGTDQESYNYLMMIKPTYQFGADVALDRASNADYHQVASIVTQCIGINCDLKVSHNYNIFGLELLTQTAENIDNVDYKPISDTYYQYSGIIDNQYDNSTLSSSYNLPKSVISLAYNNAGNAVAIAKQSAVYNDYGSPVEQNQYPQTLYTGNLKAPEKSALLKGQSLAVPEYPSEIDPVTRKVFQYDPRYQNVTSTDTLDCAVGVNHTDCGKAREVIEQSLLSSDGRKVVQKYNTYKNLNTGETAMDKKITYTYSSDTAGCQATDTYFNAALVCKETVSDDHGKSVSKLYGYQRNDEEGYFPELVTVEQRDFTDPTGLTAMAEIAGEGQESMGQTVTHNRAGYETDAVSTFAALVDATTNKIGVQSLSKVTEYNVYGLPLVEKDKEGKKISYKYDFKNLIMEKYLEPTQTASANVQVTQIKPLLQSRVQYDGLGNVLKQWDITAKPGVQGANGDDDTQLIVVQTNNYDYKEGKALLKKQTDAFGNYTVYDYDSQLRPVVKSTYQVKDTPQS